MDTKLVSRILKYYRKLNHLSVKEVAEQFQQSKQPVAKKTIYGWESGQTQPSADNFIFLCNLYHINNLSEAIENSTQVKTPVIPTAWERNLLLSYREHPEYQAAIHKLLELDSNPKHEES